MIKYQLKCGADCAFEGWFRSSDDFEAQAAASKLECPFCGSTEIARAMMAPAVVTRLAETRQSRAGRPTYAMQKEMAEAVKRAREYVEKNFDYVGERFPEEARRIHYGETPPRAVYGEVTPVEAKELIEEGVAVAPLPGALDAAKGKRKVN